MCKLVADGTGELCLITVVIIVCLHGKGKIYSRKIHLAHKERTGNRLWCNIISVKVLEFLAKRLHGLFCSFVIVTPHDYATFFVPLNLFSRLIELDNYRISQLFQLLTGMGVFRYIVGFGKIGGSVKHKAVVHLDHHYKGYYPQINIAKHLAYLFALFLFYHKQHYHRNHRGKYAENRYHNKYLSERKRENRCQPAVCIYPQGEDMFPVPVAE